MRAAVRDECPDRSSCTVLKVNGEVEQDGSTAEMVFPSPPSSSSFSELCHARTRRHYLTTGTTAGVLKQTKGKFLKSGDTLEAAIEHIGVLRNPVV